MLKRSATGVTARGLFAFILLSLLAGSLLQRYLGHTMSEPDLDFYDYFFEAAMVHEHPRAGMYAAALEGNPQLRHAPADSDVYRRAEAAGFNGTNLYLYPPLLADLLSPVATLPPHRAAALWRCLNLLIVAVCVFFMARFVGISLASAELGLLLFSAYTFWPIHENIAQGQVSVVLLGLWTIAILAYVEGRVILSAVALVLATWLKVTPVLMVPVFLIWKDRKWISSYLLGGIGLGLLMIALNGWANMTSCIRVLFGMGGSVPAMQNKSLGSLLAWIHYGKAATYDQARVLIATPQPHSLLLVAKLLTLAFYSGCLYLVWRQRRQPDRRNRAVVLAVFGLAIALIAPVSWRHGYSVALVLLILLWNDMLRAPVSVQKAHALRLWLLTFTTFTLGTLFFDLAAEAPLPAALKILCAATWTVFSLLLSLEVLKNGFIGSAVLAGMELPLRFGGQQAPPDTAANLAGSPR